MSPWSLQRKPDGYTGSFLARLNEGGSSLLGINFLKISLAQISLMKSVIIGTAGHIDHGKTALVKALTGIDADRLEEEKRRGITIDIGFAHLSLPMPGGDTLRLGFVDVPGHERFVRNMLAGVGGIDLVLLVIAADEGIKPQTREHFDICRLLSVRRGMAVLTKSDLVDRDTLQVVRLEVEEYLRGSFLDSEHRDPANRDPASSAIVAVSSLTGAGLDELKRALLKVAAEVPARDSNAIARLPIDRVFTMKGFGTVVTGTLISGTVRKDEELEVFPSGKRVRVRGVQVHGQAAEQAIAGQHDAGAACDISFHIAPRCESFTLAFREAVKRSRSLALSLLHHGDHRGSGALQQEASRARGDRLRAIAPGGFGAAAARRSFHPAPVFACGNHWGRKRAGCDASAEDKKSDSRTVFESSG